METYLTVEEAAKAMKVHPDTIRKGVREGEIPHRRIGNQIRIPESWLDSGKRCTENG